MKIVHTSDWHVGRRWKGIQRLDEMEMVLDRLAEFIEREQVELVLHTGDIFDSRNPPAEAEQLALLIPKNFSMDVHLCDRLSNGTRSGAPSSADGSVC